MVFLACSTYQDSNAWRKNELRDNASTIKKLLIRNFSDVTPSVAIEKISLKIGDFQKQEQLFTFSSHNDCNAICENGSDSFWKTNASTELIVGTIIDLRQVKTKESSVTVTKNQK